MSSSRFPTDQDWPALAAKYNITYWNDKVDQEYADFADLNPDSLSLGVNSERTAYGGRWKPNLIPLPFCNTAAHTWASVGGQGGGDFFFRLQGWGWGEGLKTECVCGCGDRAQGV